MRAAAAGHRLPEQPGSREVSPPLARPGSLLGRVLSLAAASNFTLRPQRGFLLARAAGS